MKLIGKYLLLAGLIAGAGCTVAGPVLPDSVNKNAASKPADDVPVAVSKLLPKEQLNETNGNAQAQAMYDALRKEKDAIGRTESAKRE